MAADTTEKPFRVGTFSTVEQADRAVRRLREAGFREDELSVICSDEVKARHFQNVPTHEPSGYHTPEAMVAGGAVGAAIGGLALAATSLVTAGVPLLAAGSILIGRGAFAGTFTGAMMTRGIEKETADFYAQAVEIGKILVAVEVHGKDAGVRLREAERTLAECGAEPMALVEG